MALELVHLRTATVSKETFESSETLDYEMYELR